MHRLNKNQDLLSKLLGKDTTFTLFLHSLLFDNLIGGRWRKCPYLERVSKVLAGSDFKLHIKLIQGYALIKARPGNSYGFSSSLLGQHRKAINVLLLTQAASFQKISHQWPFTLSLALLLRNCTWSESNAEQSTKKFPANWFQMLTNGLWVRRSEAMNLLGKVINVCIYFTWKQKLSPN